MTPDGPPPYGMGMEHMRLVHWVARKFERAWGGRLPGGLAYEDLVQEGWMVLERCLRKYDPARARDEGGFGRYLGRALRSRLARFLDRQVGPITVPDHAARDARRLLRGEEVADVSRALAALAVQGLVRANEDALLAAPGKSDGEPPEVSRGAIDLLPWRQRRVVELRLAGLTFAEIAESRLVWGRAVTRSLVHKTHADAVRNLRKTLSARPD